MTDTNAISNGPRQPGASRKNGSVVDWFDTVNMSWKSVRKKIIRSSGP